MTDEPRQIAIFGLGEAGSEIASGLAAAGAEVAAFDPAEVATPPGVVRSSSPQGAVQGKSLIMAITSASDAQAAIAQAWNDFPRGALYADLSTAPPTLKEDLNDTAALRGLLFADVALMAIVPGKGLSTPSLVSGSGANEYASIINELGGRVDVIGDEAGQAATHKLLRSILVKGFTAAVIEAMATAENLGLEDWTWEHVVEFIEKADRALLERLVRGTKPHVERRIVEMQSAAAMVEATGSDPVISRATERLLKEIRKGSVSPPAV